MYTPVTDPTRFRSALAADLGGSVSLPLVVAPMFLVSTVVMVVEAGRAGVMGSIPALNARTTAIFADWVVEIKTRLAGVQAIAPCGVNLIVAKTTVRLVTGRAHG